MPQTDKYLVAYDVSCDRERNRLAKLLKGYGTRVQKSVFECALNAGTRRKLAARLQRLKLRSGCVAVYRLYDGFQPILAGDCEQPGREPRSLQA